MNVLVALLAPVLAVSLQEAPPQEDLAVKLVQRIQQDLSEVDRLLDEAADATKPAGELADARAAHVRAISDLEELIRQIKYKRSGQPSSSSSSDSSGQSSSSQPSPRQADDRQQSESAPTPQSSSGQQKQPQKPGDGQQPRDSAQPEATPAAQRDANAPPPDPLDDFLRRDTDARWGVLPPKMQERLMNLHVDDVPQRYRTWLEAYVRELNRRDTGASRP